MLALKTFIYFLTLVVIAVPALFPDVFTIVKSWLLRRDLVESDSADWRVISATWAGSVLSAIGVFIIYKLLVVWLAHSITSDVISFFRVVRGVFTIVNSEQNPFVLRHLWAGLLWPTAMQLICVWLLYALLRDYMTTMNSKLGQEAYATYDLVRYGLVGVLAFILFEFLNFGQDIPAVSEIAHFSYLAISKLSLLLTFFAIVHADLLGSKEYILDLQKKLKLHGFGPSVVKRRSVLILTFTMQLIANLPFHLGSQFLEKNVLVLIGLVVVWVGFFFAFRNYIRSLSHIATVALFQRSHPFPKSPKLSKRQMRGIFLLAGGLLLMCCIKSISAGALIVWLLTLVTAALILLYSIPVLAGGLWDLIAYGRGFMLEVSYFLYVSSIAAGRIIAPTMGFFLITFTFILWLPLSWEGPITDNHTTSALDSEGNLALAVDQTKEFYVDYNQLPDFVPRYLSYQEDNSVFQQHRPSLSNWYGVSTISPIRMVTGGRGGSNLNSGTVKVLSFENGFPRDLARKHSEFWSAFQLGLQADPEQIIECYLNNAPIAKYYRGIGMAAHHVFGRGISSINRLEALYLLTTLVRSNSIYIKEGRYISYEEVSENAELVRSALVRKAEHWLSRGLIDPQELRILKSCELRFQAPSRIRASTKDFVRRELNNVDKGNGQIRTYISTVEVTKQKLIQRQAAQFEASMERFRPKGHELYSAILVADVETGEITGHYSSGLVDLTTFGIGFEVASLIKPVLCLQLLEGGHPKSLKLFDGPIKGMRTPKNSDLAYSFSYVTIPKALSASLNAPFVNIRMIANEQQLFIDTERIFLRMGISGDPAIHLDLSETEVHNQLNYPLGARRMTIMQIGQVFQCIFNRGRYQQLHALSEYFEPKNQRQASISGNVKQIYDPENAQYIANALKQVIRPGGTGAHLMSSFRSPDKIMMKTGTAANAKHGLSVLCDGSTMVVAYVAWGRVESGQLQLGQHPIPFESGGKTAGVLATDVYNALDEYRALEIGF